VLVGRGASIVRGESAEAVGDSGYEEVVTGTIPVSEGGRVVEQGVQGQGQAIDQQSWAQQEQSSQGQHRV
jgi:hypothetical protein